MNIPHNSSITDAILMEINNPLRDAGDPVIPFIWKSLVGITNSKIQVDDHGDQPTNHAKWLVQMPYFGTGDVLLSAPLFAIKHAFNF